ncbi:LCP family protein [Micrococcus porci]|uniref:LCP family protein n=1 Tax=Micrococcus porci TaxID=2856555 RepID=UPI003CFBB807
MSTVEPTAAPRRRRRPLLIVLVVLLVLLLAAGLIAALWLGGLGRTVDEGVQRFEGQALPEESLRPGEPGSAAAPGSAADGRNASGVYSPSAPPPGTAPAGVDPATALAGPAGPAADEVADGKAVDFLLVGEDSGVEGRDPNGRSDTLMWVHIPGDRSAVQVRSIMRDTWVPIPGHGDHKVNAAYQYGQIPLTVATVENMFQARVDHVVAVDMAGFQGLVDALGGITVDNPVAFTAGDGHAYPAGAIQMDGATALVYARERYNLPRGDFDRVENQQRVVKAVFSKALSLDTLSDPGRVQQAVERFSPFLTLDSELGSGDLAALAWSMRNLRGSDIQTSTVPTAGVGYSADGQAVVWPDWPAIHEIGRQIRTSEAR